MDAGEQVTSQLGEYTYFREPTQYTYIGLVASVFR